MIGGAAVLLIIYLGYTYVTNLQQDNATLTANVGKLQLANDVLVAERKQFEEDIAKTEALNTELNVKFEKAVESKNEVIKLFSDHNFTKLYNAKPAWITKKMNAATKKIFKEIEDVSRAE